MLLQRAVLIFPVCIPHLLHSVTLAVVVLLASLTACSQQPSPPLPLSICGATVDVRFQGTTASVTREDLTGWIRRAGDAVCTYYGKFPVPRLALDVRVRGGAG